MKLEWLIRKADRSAQTAPKAWKSEPVKPLIFKTAGILEDKTVATLKKQG